VRQDIRDWLRDRGHTVSDRGRIKAELVEQYNTAHANGADDPIEADEPFLIVPDDEVMIDPAPPAPVSPPEPPRTVEERKPQPPPKRRRKLFSGKPEGGQPVKRATGRKLGSRTTTESLIGGVWAVVASLAGRGRPELVPMSRMMMFQSGTVGIVGDEAVKGTWIDNVLQPLARAGEKGKIAAAILGPPAIVGAVTVRPELYPVAKPVLEALIMDYLEISEPAMEKIQKRIARMEDKLGGAKVADVLASVFADVDVPTEPSPDEEAAIRRARGE
jgi:hypothetical protein